MQECAVIQMPAVRGKRQRDEEFPGWDPNVLRELMSQAKMRVLDLAEIVGVQPGSIYDYMSGVIQPSIRSACRLADYFAVPLDVLCGRCTEEEYRDVMSDFRKNFMRLRRKSYEDGVLHSKDRTIREVVLANKGRQLVEGPYPYNLLDAVLTGGVSWKRDRWDSVLTDDQERGIEYAIEKALSDREREYIGLYYMDAKTLDEIGQENGISRERVRQVIAKALRKLRHPAFFNSIQYGLDGAKAISSLEIRKKKVAEEEKLLGILEKELSERREEMLKNSTSVTSGWDVTETIPLDTKYVLQDIGIDELELSIRSYNCLRRVGCRTVADIVSLSGGEIWNIRNLGRRSVLEIERVLLDRFGIDMFPVWGDR